CADTESAASAKKAPASRRNKRCIIESPKSGESVLCNLGVVQLHAEPGATRKRELPATEVELARHDIVGGLERAHAFQPFDHATAGRREHDLRDSVHAE